MVLAKQLNPLPFKAGEKEIISCFSNYILHTSKQLLKYSIKVINIYGNYCAIPYLKYS